MRKILISLVLGIMLCSNVFAQMNSSNHGFSKKVDITTEAGKWMVDVYLPYADKVMQAASRTVLRAQQMDMTSRVTDDLLVKFEVGDADYNKAMQNIAPPEELKVYHEKYLHVLDEMINSSPKNIQQAMANETKITKLYDEAIQEIASVFRRHGVPDDIITVLVETSTVFNPSGDLHYALHDSLRLLGK